METYVENWFDSEIAGKSQFRLITESFKHEYEDFEKMLEAIEYCNESVVLELKIDKDAIKEKIKKMWDSFIRFFSVLIKKIKDKISNLMEKFKKKTSEDINKEKEDNEKLKEKLEKHDKTIDDVSGEVPVQTIVLKRTRIDIGEEKYKAWIVEDFEHEINEALDSIQSISDGRTKIEDATSYIGDIQFYLDSIDIDIEYHDEKMSYTEAKSFRDTVYEQNSIISPRLNKLAEDVEFKKKFAEEYYRRIIKQLDDQQEFKSSGVYMKIMHDISFTYSTILKSIYKVSEAINAGYNKVNVAFNKMVNEVTSTEETK